MPRTDSVHDEANPPRHFCSDCEGTTSSRMDCKNLEKVVCFTCPIRDHYSGDCDNAIRNGNHKNLTARKEADIQVTEWKARCDDAIRLLKACRFHEAANGLGKQRPTPRGVREPWEFASKWFTDKRAVPRDSSRRLTRLKQQRSAWKKYCLIIFEKIEQVGLAEAAMDRLTRWYIDPNSPAIEEFGQKVLSKIPTTVPATSASIKAFVHHMHGEIFALAAMPGETLYWRYTIALNLVHAAVRWKITDVDCEREISLVGFEETEEVTSDAFGLLDRQFKSILEESLMKEGDLPYGRTLCILETHGAVDLYGLSWRWLREELFHERDEDVAP